MLENIEVGDKIRVTGGMPETTSVHIVTRLTRKYIVIHRVFGKDGKINNEFDQLYNKKTGYAYGSGEDWWPMIAESAEANAVVKEVVKK